MIKYIIPIFIVSNVIIACHGPSANLTSEYIQVSEPGEVFGLVELDSVLLDSALNYPIKEKEIRAYAIVERSTDKVMRGNCSLKIYFNRRNRNYYWKVSELSNLSSELKLDILTLKYNTWYRLVTQNTAYDSYINLSPDNSYQKISKPSQGPY